MKIKFTKPVAPYLPGDIATFANPKGQALAKSYVDQGYATLVDKGKGNDDAGKAVKNG